MDLLADTLSEIVAFFWSVIDGLGKLSFMTLRDFAATDFLGVAVVGTNPFTNYTFNVLSLDVINPTGLVKEVLIALDVYDLPLFVCFLALFAVVGIGRVFKVIFDWIT